MFKVQSIRVYMPGLVVACSVAVCKQRDVLSSLVLVPYNNNSYIYQQQIYVLPLLYICMHQNRIINCC